MCSENTGCGGGCLVVLAKLVIIGFVLYGAFMLLCGLLWLLPYVIILILIGVIIKGIAIALK